MKLVVIGLIFGIFFSVVAFKLMDGSGAATAKAAQAQAEVESLRAQLASLTRPPSASEGPERRPVKSLAADMSRLAPRLRGCKWENWPKEARDLRSQIMSEMDHLARENGVTVEEAMRSPDGVALLTVEAIDPAGETKLRELLAGERPAWDEWKKARPSMSALESRRKFIEVAGKTRESFLAALTNEQRSLVRNLALPDRPAQGSEIWFDGSRAEVTKVLAADWAATLNLDEQQAQSLTPLVPEYIKNSRELNESIQARYRAGGDLTREKDYAMRLDLMIQTHKQIAGAVKLSPEQKEMMKEWAFTYGVNITGAAAE